MRFLNWRGPRGLETLDELNPADFADVGLRFEFSVHANQSECQSCPKGAINGESSA